MTITTTMRSKSLSRWEIALMAILILVCLVLALAGKGRREERAYTDFVRRAQLIEDALLKYAADHDGRFPPDQMFTNRPLGLDETYIAWDPSWNIDYEVHPNGKGGHFVALEYCGPYNDRRYFGLTLNHEYRRLYSRGQPIDGEVNRIWVVREDAKIIRPPVGSRQGG